MFIELFVYVLQTVYTRLPSWKESSCFQVTRSTTWSTTVTYRNTFGPMSKLFTVRTNNLVLKPVDQPNQLTASKGNTMFISSHELQDRILFFLNEQETSPTGQHRFVAEVAQVNLLSYTESSYVTSRSSAFKYSFVCC